MAGLLMAVARPRRAVARIVAGTNPFTHGAPYADYFAPGLSTGRRIAQEIRAGVAEGRLKIILS